MTLLRTYTLFHIKNKNIIRCFGQDFHMQPIFHDPNLINFYRHIVRTKWSRMPRMRMGRNILFLRYSNFILILCYLYYVEFFDCVSTRFSILWRTEWVTRNIVWSEMRSIILLFHIGFRLPREARSTPHPPCLWPETRSIIVLFHIDYRFSHEARFVSVSKYSPKFKIFLNSNISF